MGQFSATFIPGRRNAGTMPQYQRSSSLVVSSDTRRARSSSSTSAFAFDLSVWTETVDLIQLMGLLVGASDTALEVALDWCCEAPQEEEANPTPYGLTSD